MTPNIIVVDIDSTLYPFMDLFVSVAKKTMGVDVHPEPREWDAVGLHFENLDHLKQAFSGCWTREAIFEGEPYEGAVEVVTQLHEAGYDIRYYTDRAPEAYDNTKEWLDHHGFPNTDSLVVCTDKRKELLGLDGILTIIDDRPRTIVWARYELGLPLVYSISHPYNENLTDIPGVVLRPDWYSLRDALSKQLVLLSKTGTSS